MHIPIPIPIPIRLYFNIFAWRCHNCRRVWHCDLHLQAESDCTDGSLATVLKKWLPLFPMRQVSLQRAVMFGTCL